MREAGWCHSKAFHDKWWPKICNVANSVRECFKCWCTFWLAEHMRRESWKTNTNTTTNTNNYSKYKQIWHSWYMGVGKRQITHLSGVVRLVVRHFHFLEGDNLEEHQKWCSAKKSMKSFREKKKLKCFQIWISRLKRFLEMTILKCILSLSIRIVQIVPRFSASAVSDRWHHDCKVKKVSGISKVTRLVADSTNHSQTCTQKWLDIKFQSGEICKLLQCCDTNNRLIYLLVKQYGQIKF